jgi:hypothetical protein
MAKKIIVVHKKPAFDAEVVVIEDTLEALQGLLDGGILCGIRLNQEVLGYCDDDFLLKGLPLNFMLNGEPICGPAFFSKIDAEGEEIGFATEAEALKLCQTLNGMVPSHARR